MKGRFSHSVPAISDSPARRTIFGGKARFRPHRLTYERVSNHSSFEGPVARGSVLKRNAMEMMVEKVDDDALKSLRRGCAPVIDYPETLFDQPYLHESFTVT